MNVFKEIQKELMKFGLSELQAKIYLLLVQHKELRIQKIVALSQIPRSSVYENLKKLRELGIVEEIIDDNFRKIRPYPIEAMRHGLDEKILEMKRLTNDLGILEKNINVIQSSNENESTVVHYYKGRSGARQLYWNTLQGKEVYVLSDWGAERYVGLKFYENFVFESRLRKIEDRVLINPTQSNLESIKKFTYSSSSITRTKLENIRVVLEDKILIKGHTFIYNNIFSHAESTVKCTSEVYVMLAASSHRG